MSFSPSAASKNTGCVTVAFFSQNKYIRYLYIILIYIYRYFPNLVQLRFAGSSVQCCEAHKPQFPSSLDPRQLREFCLLLFVVKNVCYVFLFDYLQKVIRLLLPPNTTRHFHLGGTGHVTPKSRLLTCKCEIKCFHGTFVIYLDMDTPEKPPHERIKTFQPNFRGFSKVRCFHGHFCFLFFCDISVLRNSVGNENTAND